MVWKIDEEISDEKYYTSATPYKKTIVSAPLYCLLLSQIYICRANLVFHVSLLTLNWFLILEFHFPNMKNSFSSLKEFICSFLISYTAGLLTPLFLNIKLKLFFSNFAHTTHRMKAENPSYWTREKTTSKTTLILYNIAVATVINAARLQCSCHCD